MHQLTEAGMSAMAEELFRLASNGQRDWHQATPGLRQEFSGFVDQMIDRARDAEAEHARHTRKGVLP